jgi:cephalosporin-C deacetylase-like acetyl esterase
MFLNRVNGKSKNNSVILILLFSGLICFSASAQAAEELNVLDKGSDKLLYDFLLRESKQLYQERQVSVRDALRSPQAVARRQKRLLSDYRRIIGELPEEKTPLNAKVTGVIECDGYRIERVIFESRPNHHVTANLYVPTKGTAPFPGVIMPCGHTHNGKATGLYQSACALLALNGFVTLIYDPICQGERFQLIESRGHGIVTHSMLNAGSLLVGRTIVGYEAWDGIRSIDYLLSRDEVDDSKPIGMTGNSGGGTQTTFLMALDDRIGPAAPSCYVMRKQRKYETIGPADGCQHLPGEVAFGIDHADYFWMRAPKPTLILAAEKDFFDFESTKDTAAEVKRLYTTLGKPEQTGLFSYDGKHSFSKPLRQGAAGWMKRWLMDDATPVIEPELKLHEDKAIQTTATGQVVTSFKDEVTVAEMNLARAKELAGQRRKFWQNNDTKTCLAEVKRLIGSSKKREKATVRNAGTIKRDGYRIDKLVIQRKGHVPMPVLMFVPKVDAAKCPATIYVDSRGKASDAAVGGEIEKLVLAGHMVLSVDVLGFGETTDTGSSRSYNNREHRVANLAMHIGRPLLGQRVDDILTAVDVLAGRKDVENIHLVGLYDAGPVAIHAGALDERFASVTVRESINSWVDNVVEKPLDYDLLGCVVPGALVKYDLPDLLRAIAPRKVSMNYAGKLIKGK